LWCALYLTKNEQNFACLSNCRYCAYRAKNLSGPAPNNVLTASQCFRFHPNRCTFGGVIAERVNAVFCPVECFYNSPETMLRFGRMKRHHRTPHHLFLVLALIHQRAADSLQFQYVHTSTHYIDCFIRNAHRVQNLDRPTPRRKFD